MSNYYDRQGRQRSWRDILANDIQPAADRGEDYRRVAETIGEAGTVSTVWLGMNHAWDDGPPLIFESMVFGGLLDQDQVRYTTEEQARAGHDELVAKVRDVHQRWLALVHDDEAEAAVKTVLARIHHHMAAVAGDVELGKVFRDLFEEVAGR